MGVKIECDGCGKQVPNEPLHMHNWINVSQYVTIQTLDQQNLDGTFCTATCVVRYLEAKGLVMKEGEPLNDRQD